MEKQDTSFCYIQETHVSNKEKHYLRAKGWKNVFQSKRPKKQAGISSEIDLQPKLIKRDRDGHFILIQREIYQHDITIMNIYAPKIRLPMFVKETLLKLNVEQQKSMRGDFNTHSL